MVCLQSRPENIWCITKRKISNRPGRVGMLFHSQRCGDSQTRMADEVAKRGCESQYLLVADIQLKMTLWFCSDAAFLGLYVCLSIYMYIYIHTHTDYNYCNSQQIALHCRFVSTRWDPSLTLLNLENSCVRCLQMCVSGILKVSEICLVTFLVEISLFRFSNLSKLLCRQYLQALHF